MAEYTQYFARLVTLLECKGTGLALVMQKQYFIAGLRPSLHSQVLATHPHSLKEDQEEALYLEQILHITDTGFKAIGISSSVL